MTTASATLLLVFDVVGSFAGSRRRRGALGENLTQIQRPVLSAQPVKSRVLAVPTHIAWNIAGDFVRRWAELIGGEGEVGGGEREVVEEPS